MENDKLLDTLFEKAREEKPHVNYEQTSSRFLASLAALGILVSLKSLLKNINLNSILMITATSVIITSIVLALSFNSASELPEPSSPEFVIPTDTVKTIKALSGTVEDLKVKPLQTKSKVIPAKEKESIKPLFQQPVMNDLVVSAETIDMKKAEPLEMLKTEEQELMLESVELVEVPKEKSLEEKIEPLRVRIEKKERELTLKTCMSKIEREAFWDSLLSLGFEGKVKWYAGDDENCIEKVKINLKNDLGMNLRLKVKGFSDFHFVYETNKDGSLSKFGYRFNKNKRISQIGLNSKNRISIEVINDECKVTNE